VISPPLCVGRPVGVPVFGWPTPDVGLSGDIVSVKLTEPSDATDAALKRPRCSGRIPRTSACDHALRPPLRGQNTHGYGKNRHQSPEICPSGGSKNQLLESRLPSR